MVGAARRWYRVAAERNVVTFKLEWTTVCVPESRVGSLSSSGPGTVLLLGVRESGVYTGGSAYTHRGNAEVEDLRTKDRIQNSGVAPTKPSSRHAILSFHNERVPSRSVSRRNFNTLVYLTNVRPCTPPSTSRASSSSSTSSTSRPPFLPFLLPLIRPTLFRPSSPSPAPCARCSFFRRVSSGSPDTTRRRTRSPVRGIAFLYFPAANERDLERHVAGL